MSVLYIMIPAALVLAGIGIFAFVYAAKSGQFDDLDTPALRAVFDDDDTIATQISATDSTIDSTIDSDQDSKENA